MKKVLFLFLFLISIQFAVSQGGQKSRTPLVIDEILEEKPSDFFDLRRIIRKSGRIPIDSLVKLKEKSIKEDYFIGRIYALHYIGIHYKYKSNYSEALKNLEEALRLAEQTDNRSLKILISNSIGSNYRKQSDIINALVYHQYALAEGKKIKKPTKENKKSISIAENSIGNIYLAIHQYDLAIEKFNKALKIQENTNETNGLAINYQNIGFALEQQGEIERALEYYQKSLNYNIQNKNEIGKLICNNSICGVLVRQDKLDEALKIAEKNYRKLKELTFRDKYYYAQTLNKLGLVYLKTSKPKKALKLLEESIDISKKNNYENYEIEGYHYLSELYDELKDSKQAFFFYKKAAEKEKKTSGEQNTIYINNLIHKHDVQTKIKQIRDYKEIAQESTHQISRSRNVLIITLVSLALLSVALYSIYRQRLLNNDKKVLTLEQQALQAQMNPHFIFNALNSIKLYIINNDQKQAVYYLNKFSKLIRNILDVSKVKEVSLKEELNTMELYMSIENIRFDNEINYVQKINSSLNLETIKVPPLVLQPFLENAIWHGLSSKQGIKEVVLSAFKVSKNLIEISITDNGVGREEAMKIKKGKSLNRKSVGIDLTIERLKTFSNDMMHEFSIKYYDLKDEQGKPMGTKVALRIPLR